MVKLERSLGLWEVTMMSIGIILGAGIYVVIGEAAGLTGNSVWLSFVIGALVASFTGLSYAELCSRYPKAGAEYVYVDSTNLPEELLLFPSIPIPASVSLSRKW